MAEARREGVKQWLLLGFVALNVILILFEWADNLIEKPDNQGFVRVTAGPSRMLSGHPTEPAITPTPHSVSTQTPSGPIETPVPYKDSGDIGMLPPIPNPSLAGS